MNRMMHTLAALMAVVLWFSANDVSASERPNIVIMLADDIGYGDPGFRGSPIETPSLDRLAREGLVLDRFYSTPICSPTRAALMTGRDPMRLGVAYGVILPWDSGGVHTREHFMPESFKAAGYQTAMVGKWHLGHSQQAMHPNERGFDHFYGHLHTEVGYYPPFGILGGKDFQVNGQTMDYPSLTDENYGTYLLANHSSEWIKNRDKSKPFFLYLPFLAPHEPLAAPQPLVDKYRDLEDDRAPARSPSDEFAGVGKLTGVKSRRPLYAATVDAMDQAVGRVLKTLDDEGIADNTIVMFFSDNGATRVYGRGGGDNSPFRGGKAEVYEGGIRVVSLMRWPQRMAAGSNFTQTMTAMDVFPTLASLAEIDTNNELDFDGVDMSPALIEQELVAREPVFFASEIPTYNRFNFAMIENDWKLVQWVDMKPLSTTVTHELFNLADDPGEYNNLADKYPRRVIEMAAEILERRALYPINGTRARISSPPGWLPPKDWADYPRPLEHLQSQPVNSMAPDAMKERVLDYLYGDRGRLIYNCEPTSVPLVGGVCW
ncbi:MAG: arylsulfatase [Cellvibrionaceae bacterium]|nr:arylsulfatase [Cellvibrionaceae bacterium]|tara:strand:+ start:3230 stop:4867 length:1638 start_codon:yes stop_codon:yes gene_type:complete